MQSMGGQAVHVELKTPLTQHCFPIGRKMMAQSVSRSSVRSPTPITVHIPAEVTFDLAKFSKVIANLGGRLGCGPCISGADCNFSVIKDYLVDPETLDVKVVAVAHEGPASG